MADRALVTGAAGFIGSFLVEELVHRGTDVHCLLRPSSSMRHLASVSEQVCIHRADLVDVEEVETAVREARPEVIYHLGAVGASDVYVSPTLAVRVNVEGTLNLLKVLDGNYRVFVNTGTCHEYGDNEPPFREDQDPRPELPYAITKTAVWHFCRRLHRSKRWPIVTVRPFSVYGPRQATNTFIPACVRAARTGRDFEMTPGEQKRDWIYVTDVVEGFIRAGTTPQAIGGTFNLCTGEETTLYETAQAIVGQMETRSAIKRGALPYRDGEIWRLVGDNTRAQSTLGWTPRTTFHQGIQLTIRAICAETTGKR
jgi:nucleoside-diphosphate-sugar epimerase